MFQIKVVTRSNKLVTFTVSKMQKFGSSLYFMSIENYYELQVMPRGTINLYINGKQYSRVNVY